MKLKKLIDSKREDILKIAEQHGAIDIKLFGSAAKGKDSKASDADFLVEMVVGSSLLDIVAIKQDLEDLLHVKVDVVTVRSLSPYFRDEVLKEAVNL